MVIYGCEIGVGVDSSPAGRWFMFTWFKFYDGEQRKSGVSSSSCFDTSFIIK